MFELLLLMRGGDWYIYTENTNELRLGLLLHVLELGKYLLVSCVVCQAELMLMLLVFGRILLHKTVAGT